LRAGIELRRELIPRRPLGMQKGRLESRP
jgi:hypothetical protein